MHRYALIFAVLMGVASQAHAQSWADGMFDELSRDFGSVPHGQVVSHPFRLVNKTKEPVRIVKIDVSCGRCSSARALKMYLEPGEETAIIVTMDTNRFPTPTKTIEVFVYFDKPSRERVRLWVQAASRNDITFNPDNIAFGRVKRGATPESKITIAFLGGVQAEILEVKSESNYVQPTFKKVERSGGETAYEITAKLRGDTPAGKWYTDIWLKTNNSAIPKLRVPVTVEVESPLTVNPSTISLGQVKAGTDSDRKVIIRGVRPFRITGIFGTDKQVQVKAASDTSETVHVLTVTLSPREAGEKLARKITVETDLQTDGRIEFYAQAEVIP